MPGRTEIRESDGYDGILDLVHRQPQLGLCPGQRFLGFQIPLADHAVLFAPAKPDGAIGRDQIAADFIESQRLPFRVIGLPGVINQIGSPQEAAIDIRSIVTRIEQHQIREIRRLAHIPVEVLAPTIEMKFAQDDVTHRHRHRRVGALLRVQPDIGELRRFRIIRAHHHDLGSLVARLGHKVRIRGAGLRDVRSPHHQERGVVPVCRFRHVGLLAPNHRAGRRQIAVPVIKTAAGPADQRQIATARRVGNHGHRRNRRESVDAIRAVFLGGVHIGGGDDRVHFLPR